MYAIANFDETSIYLNMYTSKTVQIIGKGKLLLEHKDIKQKNNSNFFILASKEILTSLLIFKAKEEEDAERKLQQIECAEKRIFLFWEKMHRIVKI